jgi:predicted Co/Zn/Cd cation transporter (cation efflux family)
MSETIVLESDPEGRAERRALAFSMLCAFVLAVIGVVIGVVTASQIILFDGFYTFLGIGLSWLAIRISHIVASGPTTRYPFGREALTPLIIGVEAVALLATCAYATFNAVLTIVSGGAKAPTGLGLAYAALALVGPLVVAWLLHRWGQGSELVSAEATQWFAGGMLGLGMLIAFAGGLALQGTTLDAVVKYIDPVLVIGACAMFVVPPARLIRRTFVELVEGVPDEEISSPVLDDVRGVATEFGLSEPRVRLTKVGRKIYVEVEAVVAPEWTVARSDEMRRALGARLAQQPLDLWLTLEFTADPSTLL